MATILLTPDFVGVATTAAHVRRALEFTQRDDVYMAIGKQTPWADEANPPDPDPDASDVEEIIGFKKVTKNVLVVPDDMGTIVIYGVTWREVAPADAYDEKARHVWVRGEFNYDELPVDVDYRQIGLYSGLVRDPADELAFPGKEALLPAVVDNNGILEYIYNDQKATRKLNKRDILNVVISF